MSQLLHDTGDDQPALEVAAPLQPAPREPRPGRVRHFISGLGAFAAVLVIVILTATLFYQHAHTTGPTIAAAPTPIPGSVSVLNDVSMVSSTEGWAIGSSAMTDQNNAQQSEALLMHYTHGVWSHTPLAIQGEGVQLTSISMLSPHDGWIGGFQEAADQSSQSILLHYDGQSWTQVAASVPGGFAQIQMLSDTTGWAIGGLSLDHLYHYDGQTWTEQPFLVILGDGTQNDVSLTHLFMLSPTEGWAVGSMSKLLDGGASTANLPTAIILHFADGHWTIADTIQNTILGDIAMSSATNGWASGSRLSLSIDQHTIAPTTPLLLHYTNGAWETVGAGLLPLNASSSANASLRAITIISTSDVWMTETPGIFEQNLYASEPAGVSSSAPGTSIPGLFHYNGRQWNEVKSPTLSNSLTYEITSLSMLTPTEGWAVGTREAPGIPDSNPLKRLTLAPVILHYHNGVWSVALS